MANPLFFVGKSESGKIKPVRSGRCSCGAESFRERYTPGKGWAWVCERCCPSPRVERQYARGHKPMGYVPGNYSDKASLSEHAERTNELIKKGDALPRECDGTVREHFRVRAH